MAGVPGSGAGGIDWDGHHQQLRPRAIARVGEAQSGRGRQGAPCIRVGYGGGVGRGRNAVLNNPTPLDGATESTASATLNAAWEIDVWGRIRRLSQAAQAQYLATDESAPGVTVSLVSEVATAISS